MLDAATGKFGRGLQLQDHGAESRVKEKLYKLHRSIAAWHSQSQSAIVMDWNTNQYLRSTSAAQTLNEWCERLVR